MKKGKKTPEEAKDPKKFDQVFEKNSKQSDKNFDKKIDDFQYFNLINKMVKDFGLKPLIKYQQNSKQLM